ncbi:MAG: hypothetical protein QOG62_1884 [Thermoleophilaceae bacterium]|nr:hypothetical protein [Thermoleophilaceae bacterium]
MKVEQSSWLQRNLWLFVAVASLPMIKAVVSGVLLHNAGFTVIAALLTVIDLGAAVWLFRWSRSSG